MAAYSIPLGKPRCDCGARASFEVFNRFNATCGKFCKKCAERKVKNLDEADRAFNRLQNALDRPAALE